jgi:hypothetical protein
MAITMKAAREMEGATVVLTRDYDGRVFTGRLSVEANGLIKITAGPGRPALTHRSNVASLTVLPEAAAAVAAPAVEAPPRKVHAAPVAAPAAPALAVPFSAAHAPEAADAVSRALDTAVESPDVLAALVAVLRDAIKTPTVTRAVEEAFSKSLTSATSA